jgi:hypothetical protein
MYNIHSHYENIFNSLKHIVTHRRLLYLLPYGSTNPENIETLTDNLDDLHATLYREQRSTNLTEGPLFIFYDQEPIYGNFNYQLFDHIRDNFLGPFVLITTEKNSNTVAQIQERYGWAQVYYFHHAFAAHDWFRGYRYNSLLIEPGKRHLRKKYISFNRLTSGPRVYRSLLISELFQRDILDDGYVSYNDVCPQGATYQENLRNSTFVSPALAEQAIANINRVCLPLRVDYQDHESIPNHSFVLSAVEQTQESFVYVVTETCYWEHKCHLTEKIFKPIVSRMPFILVGPAHNLEYLRSYGFRTFGRWFDERYDDIQDPIERMTAVADVIEEICGYSNRDLEIMLREMTPILNHNYNLFYSSEFLDCCWQELQTNLSLAVPK